MFWICLIPYCHESIEYYTKGKTLSTKVWKSFIDGPQKFLWYDLNTISWKKIFDLQYSSGNIVFDNHAITNRIPKKNFIVEKNLLNKKSRKSCIFRSKFFSFWWTIYIYWVNAKKRLFLGLRQKKGFKSQFFASNFVIFMISSK